MILYPKLVNRNIEVLIMLIGINVTLHSENLFYSSIGTPEQSMIT